MNLLCPACHTPLPDGGAVVSCPTCAAEVDVTRAGTIAGRPRFVPEIDRVGTTIGGYQIAGRIGGGGMGLVYRGVDPGGRPVAIKLLAPALASSPEIVARFAREIAALARLEHPAIVRVLAHGSEGGIPWFAMELVEGSDLGARFARGALPPEETAAVFGRLFAALAHAHERGVVHRDLKPGNVLLAPTGARLADFGIARIDTEALTGADALTRLTETAAVIGTLPYMSPEQRRGGPVDRRSDFFSAGVMLYEAATGALPQGAFPVPSQVNPAYGRAFDRLVLHLLQPDPARRPASAADAEVALSAALARRRRRRPVVLAASGAVLMAALAAGAGGRALSARHGADKSAMTGPASASGVAQQQQPPPPQPEPRVPLPQPPFTDVAPAKDEPAPPATATGIAAGNLGTIGKGGAPRPTLKIKGKLARRLKVLEALAQKAVDTDRPAAGKPGQTAPRDDAAQPSPGPQPKVSEIGGRWEPGAKKAAPAPARNEAPPAGDTAGRPRKVLPDNANFEEVEGLVKEAVPPAGNRLPPAPARKKARPKSDPGNDPGFDGLMK